MLNIVHVHINDMSEDVTLEVAYMGDGETLAGYQEFKEDQTGRILRYKVIVREQQIYRVLYNQGNGNVIEIPFEEVKLPQGDIWMLENNAKDQTEWLYVKINRLPVSMMACQD